MILPGFSIFIISAPKSPRSIVVKGPARILTKNKQSLSSNFLNVHIYMPIKVKEPYLRVYK